MITPFEDEILGIIIYQQEVNFCIGERWLWKFFIEEDADLQRDKLPNFHLYRSRFDKCLSEPEFRQSLDKPEPTYLVDFDRCVFVDGWQDSVSFGKGYFPSDWHYQVGNPFLFVTQTIRQLWLSKEFVVLPDGKIYVSIDPCTRLGIVRYADQWRIFYEMPMMWTLDFASEMRSSYPEYLDNPDLFVFRKDLPLIDEAHLDEFLARLQPYELTYLEIGKLVYGNQHKPSQPSPITLIDFERKLQIDSNPHAYLLNQLGYNRFMPPQWEYMVLTNKQLLTYLPIEIQQLWSKDNHESK